MIDKIIKGFDYEKDIEIFFEEELSEIKKKLLFEYKKQISIANLRRVHFDHASYVKKVMHDTKTVLGAIFSKIVLDIYYCNEMVNVDAIFNKTTYCDKTNLSYAFKDAMENIFFSNNDELIYSLLIMELKSFDLYDEYETFLDPQNEERATQIFFSSFKEIVKSAIQNEDV